MSDAETQARRLHIGGWLPCAGWEILDAVAREHVDHLGDAGDLSRFADGTFLEVYASHVLEHFDYRDKLPAVLTEWRRVLQPGGTLYVSVPDLERLCHLYLTPGLTPDGRYQVMRLMFGGHEDAHDFHMGGMDEFFLGYQLQQAGFTAIRRVPSFKLFADTSEKQFLGMPVSINMIATR